MIVVVSRLWCCFFFKQKTAYEMRISDWSSDVCSSDLREAVVMMRPIGLEEACRDPDAEVVGKPLHRDHRGVRRGRLRGREQPFVLDAAEIFALEQFGRQHHLRADRKRTRLNSSH